MSVIHGEVTSMNGEPRRAAEERHGNCEWLRKDLNCYKDYMGFRKEKDGDESLASMTS